MSLYLITVPVQAINITFILPDYNDHQFWYLVADAAKSAAKNSAADLSIIHIDNNRFALKNAIKKVLSVSEKPNYIVFRPFQGRTLEVFNLLEKNQVKFITLEQVATGEEASTIGKPLEKYQYWLGEIFYDQSVGSELLANTLIQEHHLRFPNSTAYITGLGGAYDALSNMRNKGLKRSQINNENAHINQVFTMHFDQKLVKKRFKSVAQRYPNTTIFWCASAQMAVEAAQQIKNLPFFPHKKLILGGFDFIPSALKKVQEGEITALVGGPFLMGAKAIIQIIDNHHGINHFSKTNHFELITKKNVKQYKDFIENKKWRFVDFSQFLLSNKSIVQPQEINIRNLINQLDSKSKF